MWHFQPPSWGLFFAKKTAVHAAITMRKRTAATAWFTSASVMLSSGRNSSTTASTKRSRHSGGTPFAPCCASASCSSDKASGRGLVIAVGIGWAMMNLADYRSSPTFWQPEGQENSPADSAESVLGILAAVAAWHGREAGAGDGWVRQKGSPGDGTMTGASWGGVELGTVGLSAPAPPIVVSGS
jgi:hypothetical protein